MQSAAEIQYASEPKFSRYAQLVERNLQSFDTVSEWADVISFLGKLLKAFQSFEFPVIPHKLVVTKRLAQCLNPALPTGVHQKTLEVYAYILNKIGHDQLAHDLSLYAYGLFPFLQYAATSVRPQLLGLFKDHFLSLGHSLIPCLQSLILALLPGLDEESSEHFQQVMALFDHLSGQVGTAVFYQALWNCLLASEQWRNSVLHYLGRRLPVIDHEEAYMTSIVRAIEATLADTDTLVQRGMLDLLVNRFPLHRQLFNDTELVTLMAAALHTVLRRDMSLNRRLYTWLLGSDEERSKQQQYFDTYARKSASKALSQLLYAEDDLVVLQKPFKIIISLLDKWEIGQPIVKETLLDVMISLRFHVDKKTSKGEEEVNWIHVIEFLLSILNTTDSEIRDVQLPCMVLFVLCKLSVMVDTPGFDLSGASSLSQLAAYLIGRVSSNAFKRTIGSGDWAKLVAQKEQQSQETIDTTTTTTTTNSLSPTTWHSAQDIFDGLFAYYQAESDPSQVALPDGITLLRMALQSVSNDNTIGEQNVLTSTTTTTTTTTDRSIEEETSDLFVGLCQTYEWLVKMRGQLVDSNSKKDDNSSNSKQSIRNRTKYPLKSLTERRQNELFLLLIETSTKVNAQFNSVTAALSVASTMARENYVDVLDQLEMPWLGSVIMKLWSYLSPGQLWLHERSIQLIWIYADLVGSNAIEAILLPLLQSASSVNEQIVALSHFCVFWRVSSDQHLPQLSFQTVLFSILDRLHDTMDARLKHAAMSWVQANLENAHSWLDPLLLILIEAEEDWRRMDQGNDVSILTTQFSETTRPALKFNNAQVAYAFHLVCRLLEQSELNLMMMMHRRVTPQVVEMMRMLPGQLAEDMNSNITYFDYCIGSRGRLLDQYPELQPIQAYALRMALLLTRQPVERLGTTNVLQMALYDIAVTLGRHVSHGQQQSQQPFLLQLMLQLLQQSKYKTANTNSNTSNDGNDTASLEWMVLLSQAALEAIASLASRSVLRSWIDFIPKAARLHEDAKVSLVLPSLNRFCQELSKASSQAANHAGMDASWDLDTLLDGLEEFVVGCLDETATTNASNGLQYNLPVSMSSMEHPLNSSNSNHSHQQHQDKLRDIVLSQLPVVIQVAVDVWQTIGRLPEEEEEEEEKDKSHTLIDRATRKSSTTSSFISSPLMPWQSQRTRNRVMGFIEHLGVLCRDPTASALIDVWSMGNSSRVGEDVMLITGQLTSIRPAFMFKKLFKKIKASSGSGTSNTGAVGSNSPNLHSSQRGGSRESSSFVVCFDFLSRYCLLVEIGEWTVLWPRTIEFIRELVNQGNRTRSFWIACLQYFITAWEKTNQSTITVEDNMQSAAEWNMFIIASSVQKRRSNYDEVASSDDDMLRPAMGGTVLAKRLAYRSRSQDGDVKLLYFVSQVLLPAMADRFKDQDRVNNTLALILHQAILPSLRKGSNFFPMSITTAAPLWTRIVGKLMATERERIVDLLGRISTFSGATTLFTNRETEALGRAQALRRFAFAVHCGKPGQYLHQLPSMQEKLVELMKLPSNNIVHVEMYLALRVLFCRIPSQNLANFLPVLITETRRLFLQVYMNKEIDLGLTNVVLAACKFIDLLFALNPKEFRIHQWIFVTESELDFNIPSEYEQTMNDVNIGLQSGLFDLLAKRFSSNVPSEADFLVTTSQYSSSRHLQRRPMISLHRIGDLRELGAFFRQIGEHTRRMTLSLAKPDILAIEANLLADLAYP
ncbi:Dopey, N-terminal-domain-containing protein [Syncephalis fuscata]|nr:Dopey, N-terminal-domain-containing protein [Syncephalis fuscata]